jgi:predicted O-methyltransferase YrrM
LASLRAETSGLDTKVQNFLNEREGTWRDMNVPDIDGKVLYDLIIKNNYTQALEIGTSTGHSGIWIAWALSKTGGKLITIDIDERRHEIAVANFKAAGVSEYIDAKLADAHEMVPKLPGPFDFVFCDADKDWYSNYLKAVYPKLKVNGCFTAHNVTMRGVQSFLNTLENIPNLETTIDRSSRSGISISYKRRAGS